MYIFFVIIIHSPRSPTDGYKPPVAWAIHRDLALVWNFTISDYNVIIVNSIMFYSWRRVYYIHSLRLPNALPSMSSKIYEYISNK